MTELGVDKFREQYDQTPYPNVPIENSINESTNLLFISSLITSNYAKNKKIASSEGKRILDVGCGSGETTLALAAANIGATIVGIDLSEVSIGIARQRLQYHGFPEVEFHIMPLENLPQLGLSFDYINCDEMLYLLPDPVAGLQAMKAVLNPEGILRANLHSFYQRIDFFRAQEASRLLGLMDGNPGKRECDIMRNIMADLRDTTILKASTWIPSIQTNEFMMVNYFMHGDKGHTIPDMFQMLNEAGLKFISMVSEHEWDITNLLKDKLNISSDFNTFLKSTSDEERLHLYELFHPFNRLLDFWCSHDDKSESSKPISDWDQTTWDSAKAFLHPNLKTEELKSKITLGSAYLKPFRIIDQINSEALDPVKTTICLKLLWGAPKTVDDLVKEWVKIKPTVNSIVRAVICFIPEVSAIPFNPITEAEAFAEVTQILTELESFGFIMLEVN
jgi:2-polyprenyl-3-methyl-5-hydroxy-6-metoxy-1,4-benzoquinol methylase